MWSEDRISAVQLTCRQRGGKVNVTLGRELERRDVIMWNVNTNTGQGASSVVLGLYSDVP